MNREGQQICSNPDVFAQHCKAELEMRSDENPKTDKSKKSDKSELVADQSKNLQPQGEYSYPAPAVKQLMKAVAFDLNYGEVKQISDAMYEYHIGDTAFAEALYRVLLVCEAIKKETETKTQLRCAKGFVKAKNNVIPQ